MISDVTIVNKFQHKDNGTKKDILYKTVLKNVTFYKNADNLTSTTHNGVVEDYTFLLPFNDSFISYDKWIKKENKDGWYTMSIGDFIFVGELADDVTADNIQALRNANKSKCCEVTFFTCADRRFGNLIQLKVKGV